MFVRGMVALTRSSEDREVRSAVRTQEENVVMIAQAVPASLARRVRVDSSERWQAALRRALDNGIRVYQISGTGEWIATSASEPGVAYRCNERECECEAATFGNDPVCQHRAALRCELGILFPEDPEPEP